ncbi:unnamed protein product [Linum tenue]|uniref:Uncharacterized protein n=1 Tax=Linum tenue TaxID=586396 RepID=A0AAV0R3A3_9ROSI|nr:unnamed protein product [Linum tenue]
MRHGFGSLIFIPKGEGRHSTTLTVSPLPPFRIASFFSVGVVPEIQRRVPSNYYDSSFQIHRDVLGAAFIHHHSKRSGLIHMSFCSLVQALVRSIDGKLRKYQWLDDFTDEEKYGEKAIGRIRLYAIKERTRDGEIQCPAGISMERKEYFPLNKFLQDWDVFPKAEKYTQEFMEVQMKDQNPRSSDDKRQNKWKRPPIGVFKLNIDAGVNIRGG